MSESDIERVRRAAEDDRAALDGLVDEVKDDVYGLARRMLGHTHDAEDATQEILLKILARLSSFRGESAFST